MSAIRLPLSLSIPPSFWPMNLICDEAWLQYVVIAGVDSVIPFYRVQDRVAISNESDYMVGAESDGNNPQYYALEGGFWTDPLLDENGNPVLDENGDPVTITNHYGFISTDDIYTDDNPLGFQGHMLFVPDRASGRPSTPGRSANEARPAAGERRAGSLHGCP